MRAEILAGGHGCRISESLKESATLRFVPDLSQVFSLF